MNKLKIFAACMFLFAVTTNAQTQSKTASLKTTTFKVWGNCGMCKTTIEGAAKSNGATYANWNTESKMIVVKYNTSKTNVGKIQKGIADAGYDNINYTANDDTYENLHDCCKYDRKSDAINKESKACCMKEGKCTADKDCCKKMEGKTDCCANGTCAKEGGCCADMKCEKGEGCCKKEGAAATKECCSGKEGTCKHH